MSKPYGLFVLTLIGAFACSAVTQVETDAAAIADRYLSAMQRKGYAFLSKDELSRRREVIAAFVRQHLHQPLDEPDRAVLLKGIDSCINRLYSRPAGDVNYRNGFGSGGEEWMYLNDRDYFRTFKYHLWVGLTRKPLTQSDARRRDLQHRWMRQYLAELHFRGTHETPPREDIANNEVRPWAMAELEKTFSDPLHPLHGPMPDDGFAKLQDRFKRSSNGIWRDFHDMEVAALTSRFPSKIDPAGFFGYSYSGQLPFDDTVVDLWGNGPSLHFASNANFRGNHGSLSPSSAYDIFRCVAVPPDLAAEPTPSGIDGGPAPKGHLSFEGSDLIALSGARIAKVPADNWFDADKLSGDELRAIVRNHGSSRISIKGLPRMNGLHRGNRSEGEFFVVVESTEGGLAVINLYSHDFNQLMFWCRPRSAKISVADLRKRQPQR